MSPLWRDELGVWLAPRELTIKHMRRGLRPVCIASTARELEGNGSDWRAALAALDAAVGGAEWRGAGARVVVSNVWARYGVVPWSDHLANEAERAAHARICLAETYGDLGAEWRVCLSEASPGESRVACALPEGLVTGLRVMLESHRIRLLSIQPSLIAAYNQWRQRLPEHTGWFVSIETGSLAAARLTPGGWDRVYAARIGDDWARELLRLKTFARMASQDAGNGRVFVDAPAHLRKLAGPCDAAIEWLEGPEAPTPQRVERPRPVGVQT